jgi:DNA-binding transcriptional LysR family regulator
MNLEDLRVFVAVCDAGNLSAVARELECTQPAVAQRVARLERNVGCKLLERGARGVKPSPEGQAIYDAAVVAVGALGAASRTIEALRAGEGGELRVTTGPTTVRHFMQRPIVAFRARHPKVALELRPRGSSRQCLEALVREPADLAFVTVGIAWPGVEQRSVLLANQALLVRAEHPLARRKRVRVPELRGLSFIGLRGYVSPQSQLASELAAHGVVIQSDTVVEDWDTAAMLVGLGLGVAIVPSPHAHALGHEQGLRSLPIEGLAPIHFGWAARRFDQLHPIARDFMTMVDEELSALGRVPGCRYLASE